MQHTHNRPYPTRKKFHEEKARKKQKGLIILKFVYYLGRTLIALLFELLRFFKT